MPNNSGSGSGGSKGKAPITAPTFVKQNNGYYKRVPDDGNNYYLGSDNRYHVVVVLRGATGLLPPGGKAAFNEWMMQHNNKFRNNQGQIVELDSAVME